MQYVAKPVLENKFWILEDNGQKVGTIRSNENGVTLTLGKENQTFKKNFHCIIKLQIAKVFSVQGIM